MYLTPYLASTHYQELFFTDAADNFCMLHIVNDSNKYTDKPTFIIKWIYTETNMTKFKQLLYDRDFLKF